MLNGFEQPWGQFKDQFLGSFDPRKAFELFAQYNPNQNLPNFMNPNFFNNSMPEQMRNFTKSIPFAQNQWGNFNQFSQFPMSADEFAKYFTNPVPDFAKMNFSFEHNPFLNMEQNPLSVLQHIKSNLAKQLQFNWLETVQLFFKPYIEYLQTMAQAPFYGPQMQGLFEESKNQLQYWFDLLEAKNTLMSELYNVLELALKRFEESYNVNKDQYADANALYSLWASCYDDCFKEVSISETYTKAYGDFVNACIAIKNFFSHYQDKQMKLFNVPSYEALDAVNEKLHKSNKALKKQLAILTDSVANLQAELESLKAAQASTNEVKPVSTSKAKTTKTVSTKAKTSKK